MTIRYTAEERALRDAARKMEREKRAQRLIREKVTTGTKLQPVEAVVLGKRRVLTPAEKAQVHAAHDGGCYVCGTVVPVMGEGVEYDHVLDRQFRGSEDLHNFGPICVPCHKDKTASAATARAKADRRRKKRNGEKKASVKPILNRGFDDTYQPLPSRPFNQWGGR